MSEHPVRLGISSYTYTWAVGVPGHDPPRPMTAVDLVTTAAAQGVHVLQIADNMPLDRLSEDELRDVEQAARESSVAIEVGTRGIGAPHLSRYLELARRFQSPILRLVVDAAEHEPTVEEIVESLKQVIPEFDRSGICLAIENHDRFRVATLAEIVERIESPAVGICLDTVNSFGSLEGPEAVVSTLGPLTVNLHVKDFTVRRVESQMGFTIDGCPAGQGRLDTPWLLRRLAGYGRDPNAILELWTPPESTISETLGKEDAWAEQSITYLRGLIAE